jgi:hypothetical protein
MNSVRKASMPRPSQDLGYGASSLGGQSGYESRPGTSSGSMRRPSVQGPKGTVILDGYRSEIMNGFEGQPRFNPVSIVLLG